MTLIKDILQYADAIAPLDTQAEWDNSGLLVGDENTQIHKVLLALDITESVVKEATDKGCELIISHHPVIFSPLSSVSSEHIVYKLVQSGVSALCLHTNLDRAQRIGVNVCLANALGLNNCTLYPDNFLCVGTLSDTLSDKEFAQYVKEKLGCNGVRYTSGKDVRVVGVCSGGGGDAVELYAQYGYDALVTGELKHHQFLYANEHNLCTVEAGHFNTEDVVINPLLDNLSAKFPDVSFEKSQALCDVVNFI